MVLGAGVVAAASMAAWVAVSMVAEAFIPLAVFRAVAFIPLGVSVVGR